MVYIVRCKNDVVTDMYLNTIGEMLSSVAPIKDYDGQSVHSNKDSIIIVATIIDFMKIYFKGYRKIILWMQGIDSEESYLKHKNWLKKFCLDVITWFALKQAKCIFCVSDAMVQFEEKKYNTQIRHKCFVMPCFNTKISKDIYKYVKNKNIFAYVGSLSKWQCFEETMIFYKNIECIYNNTFLKVFTPSVREGEKIIEKVGIRNYSVEYCAPDELMNKLYDVKFGFVLRENISVNNVATPTKLSTYMAAGVIPIFSSCILDFYNVTQSLNYVIPVHSFDKFPEKLDKFINSTIDSKDLYAEFSRFFNTYYDQNKYIEKYSESVKQIIME